jgi:ribosomal protein L13
MTPAGQALTWLAEKVGANKVTGALWKGASTMFATGVKEGSQVVVVQAGSISISAIFKSEYRILASKGVQFVWSILE